MKFGSFLSFARVAPVALLVATVATGCTLTIKTKTRYVLPDGDPSTLKTAAEDWAGEPIDVQAAGVQVSVNGGASIRGVAGLTKITVKARVLAMADDTDKASAELSLAEAAKTLSITKTGGKFVISCGHGQAHGTSTADTSGCEMLDIQIPAGTTAQPVSLSTTLGNGSLSVTDVTVMDAQIISSNDVTASLSFVKGATIVVSSDSGTAALSIPANSSADAVEVLGDATKSTSAFDGVKVNGAAAPIGTPGDGAKSIKVEAKEFAGSRDVATLSKR